MCYESCYRAFVKMSESSIKNRSSKNDCRNHLRLIMSRLKNTEILFLLCV